MATLSEKAKRRVPKAERGVPSKSGTGSYPMPDKAHAANAKARATQQVKKGNLSSSQAATIKAKANKILGRANAATRGKGKKKGLRKQGY
jgi:hypothetical protein